MFVKCCNTHQQQVCFRALSQLNIAQIGNNYYLEYIQMDQNGNKNIVYGTQCHNNNNVKIVNGSKPLSQESYTELPEINVQDPYTQLHRNPAVSKSFNSNLLL